MVCASMSVEWKLALQVGSPLLIRQQWCPGPSHFFFFLAREVAYILPCIAFAEQKHAQRNFFFLCNAIFFCNATSSFSAICFFSPPRVRGVLVPGGNVRVPGFEVSLAVLMCTHCVVLASFLFPLLFISCLFFCTPRGVFLIPP